VISGCRREVDENCAVLGDYAASSDDFLPTFRNKLSVPSSGSRTKQRPVKMGAMGCHETSVRNYHYSLRNDPEERSSHLAVLYEVYASLYPSR
jgi:hypothetical protein